MKVAIVTGASSGIGAEFARSIRSRSDDEIWLVARREERLRALAEELGGCRILPADLATDAGIGAIKGALRVSTPEVSYLVNAAGFGDFGGYDELSEDKIAGMIDLNVKALVLLTHATLPYMTRGGRIIELGSGSCFTPLPSRYISPSRAVAGMLFAPAAFSKQRRAAAVSFFVPSPLRYMRPRE